MNRALRNDRGNAMISAMTATSTVPRIAAAIPRTLRLGCHSARVKKPQPYPRIVGPTCQPRNSPIASTIPRTVNPIAVLPPTKIRSATECRVISRLGTGASASLIGSSSRVCSSTARGCVSVMNRPRPLALNSRLSIGARENV